MHTSTPLLYKSDLDFLISTKKRISLWGARGVRLILASLNYMVRPHSSLQT
jgi:hypothetical protein